MAAKTEEPRWVYSREPWLYIDGARPKVWRTIVVRDRHTGRLAEVPLTEEPPIDPGADGTTYVFRRGEKVLSDHPAVIARPGCFIDTPPRD